jgi:hypothetical protein
MALDFPTTPAVGDTYVSGGTTWTWDGAKWTATGGGGGQTPGIPEAPTDGFSYARQGSSANWNNQPNFDTSVNISTGAPSITLNPDSGQISALNVNEPANAGSWDLSFVGTTAKLHHLKTAGSVNLTAFTVDYNASTFTMGLPLTLAADPTANLVAATKQYVDNRTKIGDNRIINGDMVVDQRNNGNVTTVTNDYTADRWKCQASVAGKLNWQRVSSGPTGFGLSLKCTSLSAYTPAAADVFSMQQVIESSFINDFAWGAAGGSIVQLSFWAFSSVSGTFSGSIQNGTGTRSYAFSYPLTANTWRNVQITIPADSSGTWALFGSGAGVIVNFDIGSGSGFKTTANSWQSGNYIGVTGSANVIGTNGGIFAFTGVKLETGSVVTAFNRQSLQKTLAECQRYFSTGNFKLYAYGTTGSSVVQLMELPVTQRNANPTVVGTGMPALTNCTCTVAGYGQYAHITAIPTATGMVTAEGTWNASSEF